jgi:glycosyltransferase involved in cell wall biosynthesis
VELSIVIPYFNRADTVPLTLESVERARADFRIETILVDDGSPVPASEALREHSRQPDRIIRQENQGLLFARLTGLKAAKGEFVLFLDSDDLIGPEKLTKQIAAMRQAGAGVSYSDTCVARLGSSYETTIIESAVDTVEDTTDAATFFIRVQPAPHSPIFNTAWLRARVEAPLFPPATAYNPVAEIWFYHVAAPFATKVVKVPGPHTLIGHHGGARLTNHWEKMGVASLAVMEAFDHSCPREEAHRHVRQLLGEKAFSSWRALPYDFCPEFDRRLLALWQRNPRGPLAALGGRRFCQLARWIGAAAAGRVFRRINGHNYRSCRTLAEPSVVKQWLAQIPAA